MFNPKDHIYDGHIRPYCLGQGHGRRCPVCGRSTDGYLPVIWYEGKKSYMAFFCKEHGPEDLKDV